ncbi:MAG: DUF2461 domain-containing protein [Saprospiraceae bacterium]|nr:DUF2461 domain-containing protein [Saprospiraceae bacterium]
MAAYFDAEFLKFFKELKKNNNREWFQANKERFKVKVEQPFHELVTAVIEEMKSINPRIQITAKDAIFRIYKDIRFSNDKTPYKEFISAIVSQGGRKDYVSAGLYFELNHEGIKVYSGIYMPDKNQLASIRYYIADHLKEFQKAKSDKKFVKRFGKILGDQNKVLPADLKEAAALENLIYNKNFYFNCSLDKEMLHSPKLVKELVSCFKDAMAVNSFLEKAILAGK